MSEQKLIKNVKNGQFNEFSKTEACGQTVLPDRSILKGQKICGNAKIAKFKCDILSNFQTMCLYSEFLIKLNSFLLRIRILLEGCIIINISCSYLSTHEPRRQG